MDREVIAAKLESLRRCIQRIEDKCPSSADVLAADVDLQDILSLNLSRAVQLSVDIAAHIVASQNLPPPATMGQAFDCLASQGLISGDLASRLRNAVGFRNIAFTTTRQSTGSLCTPSLLGTCAISANLPVQSLHAWMQENCHEFRQS